MHTSEQVPSDGGARVDRIDVVEVVQLLLGSEGEVFGESVRLVCVCVVALVQILVREILLDDDERDEFFVK